MFWVALRQEIPRVLYTKILVFEKEMLPLAKPNGQIMDGFQGSIKCVDMTNCWAGHPGLI